MKKKLLYILSPGALLCALVIVFATSSNRTIDNLRLGELPQMRDDNPMDSDPLSSPLTSPVSSPISDDVSIDIEDISGSAEVIDTDTLIQEIDDETTMKTHAIQYDSEDISNPFSIEFPSGSVITKDDRAATWDISASIDGRSIWIDFSAQGSKSFIESLEDWLTLWGSYNLDVSYQSIESGRLLSGVSDDNDEKNYTYELFQVSGDPAYYLMIVDVDPMYSGRSHLAIRSENLDDLGIMRSLADTLEPLPKE